MNSDITATGRRKWGSSISSRPYAWSLAKPWTARFALFADISADDAEGASYIEVGANARSDLDLR
jgi:hypothetical protein